MMDIEMIYNDFKRMGEDEKRCPPIPKKYQKTCWHCEGKGYTEEIRICFGHPGHTTVKHDCSVCCKRGYIGDTNKKKTYKKFRTKKIMVRGKGMTTEEFINQLFDEKEKEIEDKLRTYTILTHITPEQEKEGFKLVDEIKALRKHREAFNELMKD